MYVCMYVTAGSRLMIARISAQLLQHFHIKKYNDPILNYEYLNTKFILWVPYGHCANIRLYVTQHDLNWCSCILPE